MNQNLLDMSYRKKVIKQIKSDENVQRKIVSYKKHNMQCDNFYQYVKEYLESKLDAETVKEMHIFSEVNLQRRVSKSEASIYKNEPNRMFNLNDKQYDDMNTIYELMNVDSCLARANEAYKYQDQCAIQIYPQDGDLKCRVLLPHHYDVIPDDKNPEQAYAYIISNFDNTSRDKIRREDNRTGFSQGDKYRDGVNQDIADPDDSNLKDERYYFWTKSMHMVCDGLGRILDKETLEPIAYEPEDNDPNVLSPLADYGCHSFIDVAKCKDFEFWVRSGDVLYNSTIMYNVILTSEFSTVEMQGHAQPYYRGDAEHMPENIRVGVDKMIFIPVNPNNEVNSEFGFANPGSDLKGIREFRESFLNTFLSSRGLDTSVISGESSINTASSGVEKMLQMIEKFEASQEDFSLFKFVEQEFAHITACWIASLKGERIDGELILGEDYQLSDLNDPNLLSCNVEFSKPQMIMTEMEKLDLAEREIEIGVSSKVHYLMENKGMSEPEAVEHLRKVEQYEALTIPMDGDDDIEATDQQE